MSLLVLLCGVLFVCFGLIVFFGAPFVPTRKLDVEKLFDAYALTPDDVIVDLGSGDGRVLEAAAERGVRSVGYELNPILALYSRLRLRRYDSLARVYVQDFWSSKLPPSTTVVFVFLAGPFMSRLNKKLSREAARIGHDITLVSYGMQIPGKASIKTIGALYVYSYKA